MRHGDMDRPNTSGAKYDAPGGVDGFNHVIHYIHVKSLQLQLGSLSTQIGTSGELTP